MTVTVNGSNGLTFGDGTTLQTAPSGFGFKNRIINGAMVIDQRNAGVSITPTDGQYTVDRWQAVQPVASKFSVQQNAGSVTPPAGFTNYLGVTSLSAYSVGAAESFVVQQKIEGYNIADLAWGTASAKTVTLSFWVRSSLTGTFGGSLRNGGVTRSYPFSYTISAANTWEQKSITIVGCPDGTWGSTNGNGIILNFGLGVGSTYNGTAGSWASANYVSVTGATSVVGTNGATWYITGVQLEVGSTATSFDYRDYGNELRMCQRYCQTLPAIDYEFSLPAAANYILNGRLLSAMRATPTVTTQPTFIITSNVTSPSILPKLNDAFILNISLTAVNTGSRVATNANGIMSAEL